MNFAEVQRNVNQRRTTYTLGQTEKAYLDSEVQVHYFDSSNAGRAVFLPAIRNLVTPVLERHLDKDAKTTLEVGCGDGFFTRELAPDWLKNRLLAFDINGIGIRRLREEFEGNLFAGSSFSMPLQTESIDEIIGYSSFDTYIHLDKVVDEAKRVLKPHGKLLLFQDLATHVYMFGSEFQNPYFDQSETVERYHMVLTDELKKKGLGIVEGENEYLQGFTIEPISSVQERVADFEFAPLSRPLAVLWDRGKYKPLRESARKLTGISSKVVGTDVIRESKSLLESPFLAGNSARVGDLVEVVRMRYLIAEKAA